MSIERYYHKISVLRFDKGGFGVPSEYVKVRDFMGLVQVPSNSNTFNNSKDTSSVSGVLFCSIKEKFEPKDLIEDNGQRYIISGQNTQNNGVAGITPRRGQHAEYRLEWTQEGI